jgi:hypothetical protein
MPLVARICLPVPFPARIINPGLLPQHDLDQMKTYEYTQSITQYHGHFAAFGNVCWYMCVRGEEKWMPRVFLRGDVLERASFGSLVMEGSKGMRI